MTETVEFNYIVFDTETGVNQTDKTFHKADPFHGGNTIVAMEYQEFDAGSMVAAESWHVKDMGGASSLWRVTEPIFKTSSEHAHTVVAHNIKFDLLYMFHAGYYEPFKNWVNRGGMLWCTMLAEYLLTGQSRKFPSLNYCSEKRGGTLKDDKIKAYWDDGWKTEDIPVPELMEYMNYDVANTGIVFRSQVLEAKRRGMLEFIMAQMDALIATVLMEWNGMRFDTDKADEIKLELQKELDEADLKLKDAARCFTSGVIDSLNAGSPAQLKALIFGGTVDIVETVQLIDEDGEFIRYKTGAKAGQIKTRNQKVTKSLYGPHWVKTWKTTTKALRGGKEATGEEVIQDMIDWLKDFEPTQYDWLEFFHTLLKHRELSKELGTYFKGYAAVTRPWNCIHPTYNHTATATGRLSCSKPNLQNVTKKEE